MITARETKMVKALAMAVYRSIPTRSAIAYKDLFAIGWVALLQADAKFSPDYGANLATYARRRVYGALRDFLREQDVCGRTTRGRINRLKESTEWLRNDLRREPSQEEIATHSGITIKQMRSTYARTSEVISLETAAAQNQRMQRFYIDISPNPEDAIILRQTLSRLAIGLKSLTNKEREVIELRYTENFSLRQISRILDRHESRICQIHASAIKTLRQVLSDLKT